MRELVFEINLKNNKSEKVQKQINIQQSLKSCLSNDSNKLVSIELCPNKNLNAEELDNLNYSFCSVTWLGENFVDVENIAQIPAIVLAENLQRNGREVLLHLAGRNLKINEAIAILNVAKNVGIRNIFALQGDESQFKEKYDWKCDLPYAVDLVRLIRRIYGNYFCIGVAAYPGMHPHSKNKHIEFMHLQEKITAGADFIITQAIFDSTTFEDFLKSCKEYKINIPIIPGIFLYDNAKVMMNMIKFCKLKVPGNILNIINESNDLTIGNFSIHQTVALIRSILQHKEVIGFHVFTLNKFDLVSEVCDILGFNK